MSDEKEAVSAPASAVQALEEAPDSAALRAHIRRILRRIARIRPVCQAR
jgi:hypothetical protein